jgi:hypothetical protein
MVDHGKNATPGVNNMNPPDDAPEGTPGEQDATVPADTPQTASRSRRW